MKNLWIAVVLTAAAFGATRHAADVVVYLHHGTEDASLIGLAEGQAQKMLASVGVAVEWRLGTPSYHGASEVIEAALVDQQDPAFRPGSLAFSTLGVPGGTRIQVFYNRVVAAGPAQLRPFILAHVLVHEITHVLEGVNRHSESGVMKAQWGTDDYRQMRRAPLPFAAEDIRLIEEWKARHTVSCWPDSNENTGRPIYSHGRYAAPKSPASLPRIAFSIAGLVAR